MTAATANEPDINALRVRIDELDDQLIQLWRERAETSAQVGQIRMRNGGTRLSLAREQQIIHKFQTSLGPTGARLALLLLEAGRGALANADR